MIQLNSQAYELMFFNITTMKGAGTKKVEQLSASSMKGIDWHTYTIQHGWAVQGIWPGIDYTDVNSVDRSHDGTCLVTGDDFGTVKLFKYPCIQPKAAFNEYKGHSSHVTKVKFTANDTLVVSTGGGDKTVMVWDTNLNEESVFDKEKRPVAQEVVN